MPLNTSGLICATACSFLAACPGGSATPITPEEQAENRTDFPLFAQGVSYYGTTEVAATSCDATVPIGDAYPGIVQSADWSHAFLFTLSQVDWQAPGVPDPSTLAFALPVPPGATAVRLGEGSPGYFVNAFLYSGPTDPALDGGIRCGDFQIAPDKVAILRPHFDMDINFPLDYGRSVPDALAEIEAAYHGAVHEIRAPQEALVEPVSAAVDVVGPIDWPPPLMNFVARHQRCGTDEDRPYYCE